MHDPKLKNFLVQTLELEKLKRKPDDRTIITLAVAGAKEELQLSLDLLNEMSVEDALINVTSALSLLQDAHKRITSL